MGQKARRVISHCSQAPTNRATVAKSDVNEGHYRGPDRKRGAGLFLLPGPDDGLIDPVIP